MFEKLYESYNYRVPYGIPVYYWSATFEDDRVISQFMPNGTEVLFGDVLSRKVALTSLGWYPFPETLAKTLLNRGYLVRPRNIPSYTINLVPGDQPILFRRNFMTMTNKGLRYQIVYILGIRGKFEWEINEDGNRKVTLLST